MVQELAEHRLQQMARQAQVNCSSTARIATEVWERSQAHLKQATQLQWLRSLCAAFLLETLLKVLDGPFHVQNGVIAGCSLATTHIRIFAMDAFDQLPT